MRERLVMAVTPMIAVATLAIGLHVGAREATRAAIVHAAMPAEGSTSFVWTIAAWKEDRGVREPLPNTRIAATLRSAAGEATWRGVSNAEGIAEARFDGLSGDPIAIDVKDESDGATLARGAIDWSSARAREREAIGPGFLPSIVREGELAIDVAVYGGALVAGHATPLFVRARGRDGAAASLIPLDAEGESGLELAPHAATCANGWAEIAATATFNTVRANITSGASRWYGAIPVAGGASSIALPRTIRENEAHAIEVYAAPARAIEYVDADDASGRAFATSLTFTPNAQEIPHATIELPPMHAGLHWITTSSDALGARSLGGATIARPLLVSAQARTDDTCTLIPEFAEHTPRAFLRWTALDGFVAHVPRAREQRRAGIAIGIASLAIAAMIEVLLLLRVMAASRRSLARVSREVNEEDASDGAPDLAEGGTNGVIAIGLALLGFGLLAAMLLLRGM